MKINKSLYILFSLMTLAGLVLSACQPQQAETVRTVFVTQEVEVEGTPMVITEVVEVTPTPDEVSAGDDDVVTYESYSTTDIPTLDPQTAEDSVSITYIENLFVHLANYDLETAEIVPEAALSWEGTEDGLAYTFNLRTDIPWVYHNPVTGETTQAMRPVFDEEGNQTGEEPAFVTANDFVYAIKRACMPTTGSYYSSIIAPLIRGCEAVLNAEDAENIPQEDIDAIGVSAPDPATLVIELEFPASYFISMIPMWTLAATPEWVINEFGENWIEAGNIVTNGRYVLTEWVHGVRRSVQRNPLFPEDMAGSGNIERLMINVVPDVSTGYALWLNNDVDDSNIPDAEIPNHLQDFPDETIQVPDLAVFYIAFRMTKPPFDDVRVRRAFSAAFDRETFVEEVIQGQGLPMIHFAPPGIFGAPPIDEVGVGFNPEFARQQLAEAGYPNCEGFPTVTLTGYSGPDVANWIQYAQGQWQEHLGCPPEVIVIEQLPFNELLDATAGDVPDSEAPHMWTLAWGPDYADENNWVGDVLWCQAENRSQRTCNELDDLIIEARQEQDPDRRTELYRQLEEAFFGPEGEAPFFPMYVRIQFLAQHSWLTTTRALFGGEQWYNWSIDWEAKQSAQ